MNLNELNINTFFKLLVFININIKIKISRNLLKQKYR